MPRVSVIVPVYNPGADFDECLRSLLAQSMPAGECELIFVDDGSTDGTGERLDATAAEHAHVRVAHIPNSGWPGRPRNVGLDLARGDYVYFVDNDDWLAEEALERLHRTAVTDGADIVVGKVVGHGKSVPRALFRQNVHGARFESTVLLGLLTPHKLFRRAFLAEHGLRFPEGRRRLEDHALVVAAYLRARRISVLADYPCYHWVRRDRGVNASSRRLDGDAYFGNVREVLDLVEQHLEPGPFRDSVLAHWYRGKMLQRVGGPAFVTRDDDYRRELYEAVRAVALERYTDAVHEQLPFSLRVRSQLLRAGDYDGLLALAELEASLNARVKLRKVLGPGTHLVLRAVARMPPLRFTRDGDRVRWSPGTAFAGVDLDATAALAASRVNMVLRSHDDETEYALPGRTDVRLGRGGAPVLDATARITPTTAAGGAPLPGGRWEVRAIVNVAGFSRSRRIPSLTLTAQPPARIAASGSG